jgi:CO/xanthine dehydrogenase Mo-binding subunit
VAPAIANAVYAATGARMKKLSTILDNFLKFMKEKVKN